MINTPIEQVVMRRVRTIRVLRVLLSNGSLAAAVLLLALWGIGREVWVARVFQNAPRDIAHLPAFYMSAFVHTRLVVQALALATLAAFIMFARETARGLLPLISQEHAHA